MSNVVTFRTNDRVFNMPHITTYQLRLLNNFDVFLFPFWRFFSSSAAGCLINLGQAAPEEPDNERNTHSMCCFFFSLHFLLGKKIISFTRQIHVTCDTKNKMIECMCGVLACVFVFVYLVVNALWYTGYLLFILVKRCHEQRKLQYCCEACDVYLPNKVVFEMEMDDEGR